MITVGGRLKGGSGKSTLTFNLALWLIRANRRVLVIDADPQATLSDVVDVRREEGFQPPVELMGSAALAEPHVAEPDPATGDEQHEEQEPADHQRPDHGPDHRPGLAHRQRRDDDQAPPSTRPARTSRVGMRCTRASTSDTAVTTSVSRRTGTIPAAPQNDQTVAAQASAVAVW